MADIKCDSCSLKAKYDQKPKSFAGRFWRWHINFCPGWKAFMNSLPDEERRQIALHYNQKKYLS
jgi:hypothetical protein